MERVNVLCNQTYSPQCLPGLQRGISVYNNLVLKAAFSVVITKINFTCLFACLISSSLGRIESVCWFVTVSVVIVS